MADETTTQPQPEVSESQKRIIQLSEKVETTAKERDELKSLLDVASRERDFYANFTEIVATNPLAKDHKDDILAKVKSGYTAEDAAFAVLGKAGKLVTQQAPQQEQRQPQSPAGGSAPNTMSVGQEKSISEMTQEERRTKLMQELSIG